MQQLSGADSLFLAIESRVTPMNVGGLVTLDTTEARDFGFEQVRDLFLRRLGRVPKYTWRLEEVPFKLDRPFWTEGDLDIDEHVGRIEVDPPAGPREVAAAVRQVISYRLDRDRPLWKLWYLDGLADGTAAVYTTYHHCLMDGASGATLGHVMLDLEPDPALDGPDELAAPAGPGGRESSGLEHVLGGGMHLLTTPVKAARFAGGLARRAADLTPGVLRNGVPKAVRSRAPRTSFNRAVGEDRAMAFSSISLGDVKAVRRKLDVTVNDVLVALCSAALERYLREIGERVPGRPFAISVPISMRAPDDVELTNRVASLMVSVPTGVDPIERVQAVSGETTRGKEIARRYRTRLPSVGELIPPFAWSFGVRAVKPFFPLVPVITNTIVSTIQGAPFPLYVAGARVTGTFPTSMVLMNMGVNFTSVSSDGHVDVGVTVDSNLVPDPWLVADAIPAELEVLMHAAGLGDPERIPLLGIA